MVQLFYTTSSALLPTAGAMSQRRGATMTDHSIPRSKAVCASCGGPVSTAKTKLCRSCFEAKAKRAYCKTCGKQLKNIYATQCASCYQSTLSGSGNPRWNPDKKCTRCGARITSIRSKLCKSCYEETHKGLPRCRLCGGHLSRHTQGEHSTRLCQKCYRGKHTKVWNHDLTDEERANSGRRILSGYAEWRSSVFHRDGYTCMKCGDKRGHNLVAHHIFSWKTNPSLRLEISNGITLCAPCHRKFHSQFGLTGNNAKQLEEFLQDDV